MRTVAAATYTDIDTQQSESASEAFALCLCGNQECQQSVISLEKGVTQVSFKSTKVLVVGSGFEPLKAKPADLQSAPIGHSGNPPFST